MTPELSIVVPTRNRLALLRRCLEKIRQNTRAHSWEAIVVDGGSTDGTRRFLEEADEAVVPLFEEEPQGPVRAFNRGLKAARGRYSAWLNDDAYPLPHALDNAIRFLELGAHRDIGLVALYHDTPVRRNVQAEITVEGVVYRWLNVRGVPYANFGLARSELFARLGYFDEEYHAYAPDPDFSLKVWAAGLRVEGCPGALIHHDQHLDSGREDRSRWLQADNERLFRKWSL